MVSSKYQKRLLVFLFSCLFTFHSFGESCLETKTRFDYLECGAAEDGSEEECYQRYTIRLMKQGGLTLLLLGPAYFLTLYYYRNSGKIPD